MKKLFLIWIALASIDFCILTSVQHVASLSINPIVGVIVGLLLFRFCSGYRFRGTPTETVIDIVLDICIVWNCYALFFNTWRSSSKMHHLLGMFTSNEELVLRIISLSLAVFAIPLIHIISFGIVRGTKKIFKSISWKQILTIEAIDYGFILRSAGICISNIIIAALCGLLLLCVVYKLPQENIVSNVEKSAHIVEKEGTYPSVHLWCLSKLDNFTDSLMLAEASDVTDKSTVNKALMVYRGIVNGKNPQEALTEHFVEGTEYTSTVSYARYWHGYHIFLKPLLEIMDYKAIRLLNGIIQLALFVTICLLMKKKNLSHFIIPYFISYLMLVPTAIAMSLQFSSCYYISSVGVILLLSFTATQRNTYSWLVFLNIGILTAFFDLLTYPIATFGIPAVILLALTTRDEAERKLRNMIKNGIAWCAGYGGMWISKWIITASCTDYDIFEDALGAFSSRISLIAPDGVTKYSIFHCIINNYAALFSTPFTMLILALIFFLIFYIRKENKHDSSVVRIITPYIMLALAPVVWFCFATNHSMIHYWFTNKCCIVSVMAILFGLVECYASIHDNLLDEKDVLTQWIKSRF